MITRLGLLLAILALPLVAGGAEAKPNVILILADDLGWGDPGCYQAESKIKTPAIDALARQGMRFTDAHTPSGVCTPTRYGLLTGRYCWRSKLKKGVLDGYSPALLEPGRLTLASLLKEQGYRTMGIGKWHLGLGTAARVDYDKPLSPGPLDAGFDRYFGIPASLDMDPYVYFENNQVVARPTEQIAKSEMRRHGGGGFWRAGGIAPGFKHVDVLPKITERADQWIAEQKPGQPFFLYFPLTAPHTPWMPTDEFRGKSQVDWYGDFVMQTDATVARVMAALDKAGVAENTLFVFTSDNGSHWLPSDIEKHGHRANAHWRGQKADAWEGGHRVPFIVRWPGKIAAGSKCDATICHVDFLATVAAILGKEIPDGAAEDSHNYLAALRGEKFTRPAAVVHHSSQGLFAIRQGDWKLIAGLGSGGFSAPQTADPKPDGPQGQLYNLATDPSEKENLWLKEPQKVAELQKLLSKYQSEGRSR